MECSQRVWKSTLIEILTRTYHGILDESEINERIDFILSKINDIDPICLYKCILYNDTQLEVGKIAIDYRISFASTHFREAIETGKSIEIDNLEMPEKSELEREIHNCCLIINHAMSKSILSNTPFDMRAAKDELNSSFKVEIHPEIDHMWFRSGSINYLMSINQIVYACIFNQNPYDAEVVTNDAKVHISASYPIHCKLFAILHSKYRSGIKLELVRNSSFFG